MSFNEKISWKISTHCYQESTLGQTPEWSFVLWLDLYQHGNNFDLSFVFCLRVVKELHLIKWHFCKHNLTLCVIGLLIFNGLHLLYLSPYVTTHTSSNNQPIKSHQSSCTFIIDTSRRESHVIGSISRYPVAPDRRKLLY